MALDCLGNSILGVNMHRGTVPDTAIIFSWFSACAF